MSGERPMYTFGESASMTILALAAGVFLGMFLACVMMAMGRP